MATNRKVRIEAEFSADGVLTGVRQVENGLKMIENQAERTQREVGQIGGVFKNAFSFAAGDLLAELPARLYEGVKAAYALGTEVGGETATIEPCRPELARSLL